MKGFEWLLENKPEPEPEKPPPTPEPAKVAWDKALPKRCVDCARKVKVLKPTLAGRKICIPCYRKKYGR